MNRHTFVLICQTILVILVLAVGQHRLVAGVPSTDLILYGRVFQTDGTQIVGVLPGAITVGITRTGAEAVDPVLTSTAVLFPASPGGPNEAYVLRIPRSDTGTPRTTPQSFLLPGDRLHIYLNGVEVAETKNDTIQLLATDAVQDIRFLSLNGPSNSDSDLDGLPDEWERTYLGNLLQGADDDGNGDRVSNVLAYALGLNPNVDNSSNMPFLRIEQDGVPVYYFRQSSQPTGFTYSIIATDGMEPSTPWDLVDGVLPQEIGVDGDSRLMKAVIPQGLDRPFRYFRLQINP